MWNYLEGLQEGIIEGVKELFDVEIDIDKLNIQETKKEYTGDYTLVVFPLVPLIRRKPEEIGNSLGQWIVNQKNIPVDEYSVIKGFLNFTMTQVFWMEAFRNLTSQTDYKSRKIEDEKVLVEFSSPNTNKPLHLGHIRNILLGWSMSRILQATGHHVTTTQIVNDRGIAICKSMLAWKKFGEGVTPNDGIKGDHLVGEFYVRFEQSFQEEYREWQQTEAAQKVLTQHNVKTENKDLFFKKYKNDYFNQVSPLGAEARQMLKNWENGDHEIVSLWRQMNQWVYDGFEKTYQALGVHFDSYYYESDTYLLGKDLIADGLKQGIFYKKDDGSVWIDLSNEGLDHKILLRSDGTSVYMTQDLGTAQKRYKDHGATKMIYTVADEQDYHFQVLFEIMKKLKAPFADGMYHLSYGMVELPTGRMKSREGKVVDADDLIQEVIEEVKKSTAERGELEGLTTIQKENIYRQIGLAAIKFFILKVNPKKKMIFNPEESVDIQGQTGPYVQNAFVRISSINRKLTKEIEADFRHYENWQPTEIALIKEMMNYKSILHQAAVQYDPSAIANFAYDLAKKFHRFYHEVRILNAPDDVTKIFRLTLSQTVAKTLTHAMYLLGIEMPERM